jgi:rSAM/selenodomain-associated transferase 2
VALNDTRRLHRVLFCAVAFACRGLDQGIRGAARYERREWLVKVSIIIPALNEAAVISRAIQRANEAKPHEVIVVDGGSSDRTREVAAREECRVFPSPKGRARQQNLGARKARGDVLLFLHADNWLVPAGLQQIDRVLNNPRILGGVFQHHIEASGLMYRIIERGNTMRARTLRIAYGDQGIFIRRETFWRIGGFPEVQLMEDLLLIRKLRRISPLAILPGPLYVSARRWEQHGPVRQTLRNWAITFAESIGIPPNDLARYYPLHAQVSASCTSRTRCR